MPTINENSNASLNVLAPRVNGRFVKFKPETDASRINTAKRRVYIAQKELKRNELFDKFIDLFFLQGSPTDWIPTSESTGPLVRLAEMVFRKTNQLTRRERAEKVNGAFFRGGAAGKTPMVKKIVTRDARLREGDQSRIFAYSERGLPNMSNYTKELQPLKDWLSQLKASKILSGASVDDVFTMCLDVLKSYVKVDGEWAYHGYPKFKRRKERRGARDGRISGGSDQPSRIFPATVPTEPSLTGTGDVTTVNSGGSTVSSENESGCLGHSTGAQDEAARALTNDEDQKNMFIFMARSDAIYSLFCVIFDEELPHKFDIASSLFLTKKGEKEDRVIPYLNEIILYLHWKTHVIKNPEAHAKREETLRLVARFLTDLREVYGLRTYQQMRHLFQ